MTTLAFDVYGTLINTHGVVIALQEHAGDRAQAFSQLWRDKQLEYSFRRGLMQHYAPFSVCTAEALDYAAQAFEISLSAVQKQSLLAIYRQLPAFEDAEPGLEKMRQLGLRSFAFSNGEAEVVEALLQHSGLREWLDGVVSADDQRSFKPNPAVYTHFLHTCGSSGADTWLISSNPFDVIGALSSGLRAVWVRRSPEAVFDPWGIEPTHTVNSLQDLGAIFSG